jgi:uncharacterized protein (DUF302 family)
MERLKSKLLEKGVLVFAHIDFAADAERLGLSLRPEQLLIFGNPKAGTPLMARNPGIGLDLPLKALAYENADGSVTVSYNDPEYLVARHGLDSSMAQNLKGVLPLIAAAAAP